MQETNFSGKGGEEEERKTISSDWVKPSHIMALMCDKITEHQSLPKLTHEIGHHRNFLLQQPQSPD
jgi:hypothetical protein